MRKPKTGSKVTSSEVRTLADLRSRCLVTDSGCWEWQRQLSKSGYGKINTTREKGVNRQWYAHRLSWYMANGPIPDGAQIMHSCDNPPCINPAHLSPGSAQENSDQKMSRGRDRKARKILVEQYPEIVALRKSGILIKDLAKRYNVNHATMGRLLGRIQ